MRHAPQTICERGVCCRAKRQAISRQRSHRGERPVPESKIQDRIRLALGQDPDVALFRNNVGVADVYQPSNGQTTKLRFGLCTGSSDLIGLVRLRASVVFHGAGTLIAPEGDLGRFLALEVKTAAGTPSPEQVRFLALINRFGGYGALVRSEEDALIAVERCKKGLAPL